jgi:hypothetical protein
MLMNMENMKSVYAHTDWQFVGDVTVTPEPGRPPIDCYDDWGCSGFIAHSKLAHDPLKNTKYLKDDTLYFRVSDHKPWLG